MSSSAKDLALPIAASHYLLQVAVCCRKHFRVVDAIDVVPRIPPMAAPPAFLAWFVNVLWGRQITTYFHAGQARRCDRCILASVPYAVQ